jgi:rubrerythrin
MKQNAQQDPGLESAGALEELARDPSSRRRFLKLMGGGAGAAGALSVFLAACGGSNSSSGTTGGAAAGTTMGTSTTSSMGGDVDIVNYALTLEYVEADFYKEVVSSGLFSGPQLDLIKAIGEHEQQHVQALEQTVGKLGGTPAPKPTTKFPLDDAKSVLTLAATVENLGAAAYLGQADKIQSPEILAAALSIHSVEARHASALNSLLGIDPSPDGAFASGASMDEVLPQVKPFIVS